MAARLGRGLCKRDVVGQLHGSKVRDGLVCRERIGVCVRVVDQGEARLSVALAVEAPRVCALIRCLEPLVTDAERCRPRNEVEVICVTLAHGIGDGGAGPARVQDVVGDLGEVELAAAVQLVHELDGEVGITAGAHRIAVVALALQRLPGAIGLIDRPVGCHGVICLGSMLDVSKVRVGNGPRRIIFHLERRVVAVRREIKRVLVAVGLYPLNQMGVVVAPVAVRHGIRCRTRRACLPPFVDHAVVDEIPCIEITRRLLGTLI